MEELSLIILSEGPQNSVIIKMYRLLCNDFENLIEKLFKFSVVNHIGAVL